ncbi:MAG: hybrid sensor histidine kinase/response regulator [Aquabacterium sp.]|nr:hybrid sensor histidine kinase/response regulator [Aquabacterium sp.]MBT9609293.1 hybrid sensor histidine kinase/response regulator [Aquabacterium sp.]
MSILRRSLRGLSPIEARIDLQLLNDSWRHSPGSIGAQLAALLMLGWMVRDWPMAHWKWVLPAFGHLTVWATVGMLVRHFHRFGITESGYGRWRTRLLIWHTLEGTMWGLIAVALLPVATPEWRMTIVAALIVYGYTVMLVTIHDWAVAFVGSVPVLLLVAGRLANEHNGSSSFLALVLVVSLLTCMGVSLSVNRRLREAVLLRHENAGLVLQLREEINKVTEAKARAEAADRLKGEFFAAASHDLRQPLHVMMLLSSALKPWIHQDEGQSLLRKLQTALGSLGAMFEQMFFVARVDAQRVDYRAEALPLAEMWARLDSEFSVLCASQGLRWQLDATSEWVQTDGYVLERILRNLLNNAVRYTEHGEVRLRARKRGPWVICQVWDTGVGIQRQHRHRIFDDYFQARNDGRLSSEGLGLGLAVVRRLSLLGPTPVTVLSRLGRGSCFSVRVPRLIPASLAEVAPAAGGGQAQAAAKALAKPVAPATTAQAMARAGRGVVVLVEDDPQVRDSTSLVLQQHGWQVAGAATPDEALAAVAALQEKGRMPEGDMPAALVSDHRLGLSINGLDAIRQLRYEFGDDLPAFLLTGEASEGLTDEAAQARVQLLKKPIEAERLLQMLADSTAPAPAPDAADAA